MHDITYSVEDLIIIRKFYGDITIKELKLSLKYMIDNKLITQNQKGVISDFSDAKFLVNGKDLLLLKDLYLKHYGILGGLRFAQVITTPKIAETMLFKIKNSDVMTQSFSTMKAARKWINQE
ncbi:MAG: hypothetical protein GQ527_11535 [Bacteroidales bacterium]|nr:hypothetical protein [Bacteroidales bacterium]